MGITGYLGFGVSAVDGDASLVDAANKVKENPGNALYQYAYDAALANFEAANSALVPVVGAVLASNAIMADINYIENGGASDLTAYIALASNVLTLAAQGVALAAIVGGAEVVIPIGATEFALAPLVDYMSLLLTGSSAYVDSSSILGFLQQAAQSIGLLQNSDGTYNVNGVTSANPTFTTNSSGNPSGLVFNTSPSDSGALLVPTVDSNGNIVGFTSQSPSDTYNYSDGVGYTFQGNATLTTSTGILSTIPNSPNGAQAVGTWEIPQSDGTVVALVQYSDGTFGQLHFDSNGGETVTTEDGAPLLGQNNQISISQLNGVVTATITGSNAYLNGNSVNVVFEPGSSGEVDGDNNQVFVGSGASADISGGGSAVTGDVGSTINIWNDAGAADSVIVSNGTVSISGTGGATITGSNNTIELFPSGSVTVSPDSGNVIENMANGNEISFVSVPVPDIFTDYQFDSTGIVFGVAGSSDTFTENADGSMSITASGQYLTEKISLDTDGKPTQSTETLLGYTYQTTDYIYSGGALVEEDQYTAAGNLSAVIETDASGIPIKETEYSRADYGDDSVSNIIYFNQNGTISLDTAYYSDGNVAGQGQYDSDGNMRSTVWYNDNGTVDEADVVGPDGSVTSTLYDINQVEYQAKKSDSKGDITTFMFHPNDPYAYESSTQDPSNHTTNITYFNSTTGAVNSTTNYIFDSSGHEIGDQVFTSTGGTYFSQLDLYDTSFDKLGSVSFDSDTGEVTAYTGTGSASTPAVALSNYPDVQQSGSPPAFISENVELSSVTALRALSTSETATATDVGLYKSTANLIDAMAAFSRGSDLAELSMLTSSNEYHSLNMMS